jgi:hypothetical protein
MESFDQSFSCKNWATLRSWDENPCLSYYTSNTVSVQKISSGQAPGSGFLSIGRMADLWKKVDRASRKVSRVFLRQQFALKTQYLYPAHPARQEAESLFQS